MRHNNIPLSIYRKRFVRVQIGDLVRLKNTDVNFFGIIVEEISQNEVSVGFISDTKIYINQIRIADLELLSAFGKKNERR